MDYRIGIFFILILIGGGCLSVTDKSPTSINEDIVHVAERDDDESLDQQALTVDNEIMNTALYRASWFDVAYPDDFIARPLDPTNTYDGVEFVTTDEAYFTAPDGEVEFFVFSPQWSGDPFSYLSLRDGEEVVDEEIKTGEDNIIKWITIYNEDEAYYRSYVSEKRGVDTGSPTHLVFGIQYADNTIYSEYKLRYQLFKDSLIQYAD